MAQKQQQQKLSHADAIRLYWTPERIRSAVPEDDDYEISGIKEVTGFVNVQPTVVPDDTRKTFPYQSVGKIVYKKGVQDVQATAYVVKTVKGNNIVFTAAHNLYDEKGKAEKIMFIPACQTDQKPVPEFGQFPQIEGGMGVAWFVAKGWDPVDKPYYLDMGAIKLEKNEAGKDVGEVVAMLEYAVDHKDIKDVTDWRIIGYVTDFQTKQDTMYQSDGVYIASVYDGKLIVRTNPVINGMSGGPWLLKNGDGKFAIANGVQVGTTDDDYSAAAYFSTPLVKDDIIAQL